jgi:hypothetical protein
MARHPADDFNMARFNIDPGAAADAWSRQEAAHEREQRVAADRAHADRLAAEESRTYRRMRRQARGARLGGCLIFCAVFLLGIVCGMAIMIVGG